MKSYNIDNYVRWKNDMEKAIKRLPKIKDGDYTVWNREQMITGFLPLVENLSRKFSTSQQASGVMDITDLIQEGNSGLTKAVDRLDYEVLVKSEDQEKTLKSFLAKRIRGQIRRAIDINRGDMRIPEHKLNEIRRSFGKDKKMVEMFFNSIFLSIDEKPNQDENMVYQIPVEDLNEVLVSLDSAKNGGNLEFQHQSNKLNGLSTSFYCFNMARKIQWKTRWNKCLIKRQTTCLKKL